MELVPHESEAWRPDHWTTREVSMLAFLTDQSLVSCTPQNSCKLRTCMSVYMCDVCACTCVQTTPHQGRRSLCSLDDSRFPHWLKLSPQTYYFPSYRSSQCSSQALLIFSSSKLSRLMTPSMAATQCILDWLFPKIPPRLEHVPVPGSSITHTGGLVPSK